MKVYALVGSSGTGKSYKAMNLAREHHIKYLIDDGILISGQRKIEGSSAKREKTKVAAVKRAIFFWEEHRDKMKETLERLQPEKLLIIGTSEKMVKQISENLGIAPIDQMVFIEEISTDEEIETAKFHRRQYGKHVIPLPTVEVKKDFQGYFLDSLKIFSRVFGKRDKIIEKSVVRPTFSFMGQYTVSNKTLIQIVGQSIEYTQGIAKYTKIRLYKKEIGLTLEVDVSVKYGFNVHEVGYNTIEHIKYYLEKMTQMNVNDIELTVKTLAHEAFE